MQVGELVDFRVQKEENIILVRGMVLNLELNIVKIILFSDESSVSEGDLVFRSGISLRVPVGDSLLGRVIDPLGRTLDGKGELKDVSYNLLEVKAPGIIERKSVGRPLQTGIKTIDALFPIGRGQRELIIGDRQTGKTAIVVDSILNQKIAESDIVNIKTRQVYCIYVAIGQKCQRLNKF